jgi:hypothetical protein
VHPWEFGFGRRVSDRPSCYLLKEGDECHPP